MFTNANVLSNVLISLSIHTYKYIWFMCMGRNTFHFTPRKPEVNAGDDKQPASRTFAGDNYRKGTWREEEDTF